MLFVLVGAGDMVVPVIADHDGKRLVVFSYPFRAIRAAFWDINSRQSVSVDGHAVIVADKLMPGSDLRFGILCRPSKKVGRGYLLNSHPINIWDAYRSIQLLSFAKRLRSNARGDVVTLNHIASSFSGNLSEASLRNLAIDLGTEEDALVTEIVRLKLSGMPEESLELVGVDYSNYAIASR